MYMYKYPYAYVYIYRSTQSLTTGAWAGVGLVCVERDKRDAERFGLTNTNTRMINKCLTGLGLTHTGGGGGHPELICFLSLCICI